MLGKGDNRAIREVNRSIILDLVRRGGRISRTELARRSKLTKPTVSAIVDELIGEGIVREVGFGESVSGGGRPARLLEFNDASAAYLGIHFGVRATSVAVADARGTIRQLRGRPSVLGSPARCRRRRCRGRVWRAPAPRCRGWSTRSRACACWPPTWAGATSPCATRW